MAKSGTNHSKGDSTDLLNQYGPLIGGQDLIQALGFTTGTAFRQAIQRQQLPIKVFELPNRRGRFAFTADLHAWLEHLRDIHSEGGNLAGQTTKPGK